MSRILSTLPFLVVLLVSCLGALPVGRGTAASATAAIPVVSATVVARYPHDPRAFTQGLAIADGVLYEGTGLYSESSLRRVDLASGSVLQQVGLPPDIFGEGITVVGDRIFQLTWTSHVGYVYDRASFALIGTFGYPTEGWGLTYDGTRLILSDGSATLRFLDPETLAEVGQVQVLADGRPVRQLNELEYVDGLVYATVWLTDRIAVIDPSSGQVRAWLDLAGLNPARQSTGADEVLNGIAFDAEQRRLFVTGKLWPTLYEITLNEAITAPS